MRDNGTVLMRLLAERVPITLLMDLASPPDARELYLREGGNLDRPRRNFPDA
jgi:hypothetical protein